MSIQAEFTLGNDTLFTILDSSELDIMTFAGKDKLICLRQTLKPESPNILLNFSCDG